MYPAVALPGSKEIIVCARRAVRIQVEQFGLTGDLENPVPAAPCLNRKGRRIVAVRQAVRALHRCCLGLRGLLCRAPVDRERTLCQELRVVGPHREVIRSLCGRHQLQDRLPEGVIATLKSAIVPHLFKGSGEQSIAIAIR